MRKLCPNIDKEDGLEAVLEVPIPEEMFNHMGTSAALRWQNMLSWMKAQTDDKWSQPVIAARINELRFLLYLVGSPLLPLQLPVGVNINRPVRDSSIEASTAKYIVQQYLAATGGPQALNSLQSMCIIGQMKISSSDFHYGDQPVKTKKTVEAGGFVLWQKNPDKWCIEIVVSGCKVICGSNGVVTWRHSSNQQTPISRGPPRPLRRFLQGLDPRAICNLFLTATCIGEKIIDGDDCFILKMDTSPAIREAQSGPTYEIIHHTMWGYFSQRSGLLIKFEDSRLISVKSKSGDDVFWETSMESVIQEYKYVDSVNIAHAGRTRVTVYRYGEESATHKRQLEETWKIEEVDFNVWGLSMESFMPPAELTKELKEQNENKK